MTAASRAWALAVLAAIAGCPSVGGPGDPRLGVALYHVDGFASPTLGSVVEHPDGRAFALVAHSLSRRFGEDVAHPPVAKVFSIDADNTVTVLPPLPEPVGLGRARAFLSPTPAGVAVALFDEPVGGRVVQLYVQDGDGWASRALFSSDRPQSIDDAARFGLLVVRVFSADEVLVGAFGTVFAWSAADGRFVPLALPAGMRAARLGPAGGDDVALVGQRADGTVVVQRVQRGTWSAVGDAMEVPGEVTLDCFSRSGTSEAFTFTASTNGTCTLFRARDGVAFAGEPVPVVADRPAVLRAAVSHPHRGLLVDYDADLGVLSFTGVFDGALTAGVGALAIESPVTCDACEIGEAGIAEGADCSSRCTPRTVLVLDAEPTADADGLLALSADTFPSGLTFTFKRLPLPIPPSVADDPAADPALVPDGALRPVDDIVADTVIVAVTALAAGRAEHGGILVEATDGARTVSAVTDADGRATLPAMPAGSVTVTATAGALSATAVVDGTGGGTVPVPLVLLGTPTLVITATDAPADAVLLGTAGVFTVVADGGDVLAFHAVDGAGTTVGSGLSGAPLRLDSVAGRAALYLNLGTALARVTSGGAEELASDFPLARVGSRVGNAVYGERAGAADGDVVTLLEKPDAGTAAQSVESDAYQAVYSSSPLQCRFAWVWHKNVDQSFTVHRQSTSSGANCATYGASLNIANAPLLFEAKAEATQPNLYGFDAAACGAATGHLTPCNLWRIDTAAATQLSSAALAFAPHGGAVIVEAGALPADPPRLLRAGVPLQEPADWLPPGAAGDAALVENADGDVVLWRGSAGLYSASGASGVPVLRVPGAVRFVAVPGTTGTRALAWVAADDDPGCATGCELWSIADADGAATLLATDVGARAVLVGGAAAIVERAWDDCPGGGCATLALAAEGFTDEPFALGRLLTPAPGVALAERPAYADLAGVVHLVQLP